MNMPSVTMMRGMTGWAALEGEHTAGVLTDDHQARFIAEVGQALTMVALVVLSMIVMTGQLMRGVGVPNTAGSAGRYRSSKLGRVTLCW